MQLWGSLAFALGLLSSAQARNVTANFDILSYNDVYEMLQDTVEGIKLGGPSRVVPIAKGMRETNPNTLVLFAGDTVSPSLWSTQFNGQHMVKAHNAIGLDFASLGNHEFDFGLENFMNVSLASDFPWLNANCYESATGQLLRGTVPNAVKNLTDAKNGHISIGLFGVMYDMKDTSKGLYWKDPIAVAREQVAALQAQKVDFIIAMTHQDLADDNRLSKEVAGIDFIIGGHDHTSMLQTNYGTPYLKADFDFRSIWQSHIEYYAADANNDRTSLMTHKAIPIVESMPTDNNLDAIIATYQAQMDALEEQIIGNLCEDLDLSQSVVRSEDCKIGHLFADAALQYYGNGSADIAVMNGGGIRGDKVLSAGPLSLGEVLSWSPFGNTLMTIQTNGASLKLFLNHEMVGNCGANVIQQNGFYVHPSGFNYTYTCTGTGAGKVSSLTWLNHPTKTGDIADTDEFVMALSNYLYTTEFAVIDGVSATVKVTEAEAERVDSALEAYVSKLNNGTVCLPNELRSSVSF
ncbi:Trifunctional nucleotide phosphoesterase protein YfkN [Phytophthora citrophthora]|uniref:Trifunctional nucleotide phosphoesterase protein YfkN n=1 Tax=Phytophthora citrophthora TaxID=4793 RepID=A0AAD9GPI9_9STRA|nr:Trifunctional nucleotide phosphoesterase protein YfkN [Phytophthora citrophthora]